MSQARSRKPRLLFFRYTQPNRPRYILGHLEEHLRCLEQFFEVKLIASADCDFKAACEAFEPDAALFESGAYSTRETPRVIRNIDAFPELPRMGFFNGDSYCRTRELFLSDMHRWRVEAYFTLSLSTVSYTPEIADRMFDWPNFADGEIFRDYGESKLIPVLSTGSMAAHYPWRNRVLRELKGYFPTLSCPHFGWSDRNATAGMPQGAEYARLLNASLFVPTCGTIANEAVRKYFEIPAAKACLVAPRTHALEAAGFVDMENCVLTDETEVVDRLGYLLSHREELAAITAAGHQLVHGRHLMRHRDQMRQWFDLRQTLPATHRIVQPGPFERLVGVPNDSGIRNAHVRANGLDRNLLRQGAELERQGNYAEAVARFEKCLHYHAMPEPVLRIVRSQLLAGQADKARERIVRQIRGILGTGAATPDPVEWAYLILAELCRGKAEEARGHARAFPWLRHPELDRACAAVRVLLGEAAELPAEPDAETRPGFGYQYSVHALEQRDWAGWVDDVCRMLAACGQVRFAERLRNAGRPGIHAAPAVLPPEVPRPEAPAESVRSRVRGRAKAAARELLGQVQKVEAQAGYFLPYGMSSARTDALARLVEKHTGDESVQRVVVLGAAKGNLLTEASLRGSSRNPSHPEVTCLGSGAALKELKTRAGVAAIEWPAESSRDSGRWVLAVDGSRIDEDAVDWVLESGADVLILDGLSSPVGGEIYATLRDGETHALLGHDPEHGEGYAVFERAPWALPALPMEEGGSR